MCFYRDIGELVQVSDCMTVRRHRDMGEWIRVAKDLEVRLYGDSP